MTTFRLLFFSSVLLLSLLAVAQDEEATPSDEPAEKENILPPSSEDITTQEASTSKEETVEQETAEEKTEKVSPPTAEIKKTNSENADEVKLPTKEQTKPGIVTDEEIAPVKTKLKKEKKDQDLSPETYVQQSERFKLPENYKSLDLNTVIEQGLRENHDEKIRQLKTELITINHQSAKTAFWMPNIQLQLNTEEQRLGRLWKGQKTGAGAKSSPAGTFGLSLGDYTIFNWGKDYLLYLNKTRELSRSKEVLGEDRRALRHKLISSYFELIATKNTEKIMRNQLRQASFIFRLNKERVSVGKATRQEYYESRAQYLKAQSNFQQISTQVEVLEENLGYLLQDTHGISYIINQDLLFQRISLPLDEALGIGKSKSASILDAKSKLEIADHSYQLAAKESLPLPRLSVNLGAYTNRFNKEISRTTYETRANNSDVDIVASVNATWDILGSKGLFNSQEREKAFIEKEISLKTLTQAKESTDSIIRELYKRILYFEKQYLLSEAQASNLQKNFDTLLDSYVNKRVNINDLRKGLDELTESLSTFEQVKLEHLKAKILLAQSMGMEDLPGESFDKLTTGAKK